MSLRGALGVVGGIVGAIWGGPAGARWGFMIGSSIGSLVDPGTVKGPTIGDIAQQSAQEGGPRPIVFVRSPPITGNVIAQSEPRIEKSKSGGKGGPKVVSEQVFRTYAIGVCEGPMGAFRRIWRNNVLVYDKSGAQILTEEENNAFLENARFFMGDFTQDASPDLEAIFGVGTTPAHRGTVYMVMADEDLTDLRGAIPQWIFEVVSSSEQVLSTDVLFPWGAGGTDPRNGDNWHEYSYHLAPISLSPPNNNPQDGSWYGGESFSDGLAPAKSEGNSTGWIGLESGGNYDNGPFGWSVNGHTMSPVHGVSPGERVILYWHYNMAQPDFFQGVTTPNITYGTYCEFNPNFIPPLLAKTDGRLDWFSPFDSGETAGVGSSGVWGNAADLPQTWLGNNCVAGNTVAGGFFQNPDAHIRIKRVPRAPIGAWTPVTGSFKCLAEYADDGSSVTQYPLNPTLEVGDARDTEVYWTAAYDAAVLEGMVPSDWDYGVDYPANITEAWLGQAQAVDGTRPLPELVTEVCERANLPASLIDVSMLPESPVYGFMIINQYAVAEAIRALGQMYFFDVAPIDGKVCFIPRGGNAVALVTEDDMLEDEQEDVQSKRDDSITVPRVMHLNYHDIAGGLNTDKQTSERAGDRRSVGEASIQTAILLNADQAAQAVVINHKNVVESQKGTRNISLSDRFIELVPTNILFLQAQGVTRRMRIEKVEVCDGYQNYELAHDRQSAYTSNVEGIPAAPQTAPPSSIVGPTLIVPLDIPVLQDADDSIGLSYYVAVAGLTPAWTGALVELSYDGGANYVASRTATASSVIGELLTQLNDHPQEFPDEVSTVTVRIDTLDAELLSTDLEGMLNRRNLAAIGSSTLGWELVNFANAVETSPGEWELSYFLRGRKDTTTRQHNAGARFVLLERGILGFEPASTTDLSRTLTFRATSAGAPVSSGTIVSTFYIGNSQRERHAGYLMAHRDGGDLVVSWLGVGRLGGGTASAHGIRFSGYMVRVDDGVLPPISVPTNDETVTIDVSTLGSPLQVSVTQTNDLTGEGPAVEVILI